MSPPLPHHPHRVTHPEALLTEVPGAFASPGRLQGLPGARGSPVGQPPHAVAGTCPPGSAEGHGQAMGTPVAPWGSQHPHGQARRDRASKPLCFPTWRQGDALHPRQPCPPPPSLHHRTAAPSPGTESACLFLPQEATALRIPPVNATHRSPATRGQECRVGAGELGPAPPPRPAPPSPQHGREPQHFPLHLLLHIHPKHPQNPIIN